MKAVVFYESAPGVAANAPVHASAHRARWDEFSLRGELLMIGPFANAQDDGAMGVFTTRAAAEEFVRGDPFVLNGVVSKWTILDWNEALIPDASGVLPGAGDWRAVRNRASKDSGAEDTGEGEETTARAHRSVAIVARSGARGRGRDRDDSPRQAPGAGRRRGPGQAWSGGW
jgi:uncharacterized protein